MGVAAGAVVGSFIFAFGLSFCRPRWAFSIMAVGILFGMSTHVAVFTDRFHLSEVEISTLLIVSWAAMIATGSGFMLSYSRHAQ